MAAATKSKSVNEQARDYHEEKQASLDASQEESGGDDRVILEDLDSDEDRVDELVKRGWALTTARRFYGIADPEAEATLSADTASGAVKSKAVEGDESEVSPGTRENASPVTNEDR